MLESRDSKLGEGEGSRHHSPGLVTIEWGKLRLVERNDKDIINAGYCIRSNARPGALSNWRMRVEL